MTAVVTGRSVLSVLYAENGEATLDSLSGKLGADENAVARVIQSLVAARLISEEAGEGLARRIMLTDAGRRWCNSELTGRAPAATEAAAGSPAARQNAASAVRTHLPNPVHRAPADNDIRIKAPARHGDRMRGVHVVRVKQRQRVNPLDAASLEAMAEVVPPPAPAPVATPAVMAAPAPERKLPPSPPPLAVTPPAPSVPPAPAAPPAPVEAKPQEKPEAEDKPKPKRGPRYTIDDDGFITHIDGKKIC